MKLHICLLAAFALLTGAADSDALSLQSASDDDTTTVRTLSDKYRFHCGNDTTEIAGILADLYHTRDEPVNVLILKAAKILEGHPYVAHTLESEPEQLTINIHQLDCVTFVENCYALAMTARSGGRSWREFARNIESLRYRNAVQKGYDTRLHYTTDWIGDNLYRGNIEDITPMIPESRSLIKTLDFMTTHRDTYPALANDSIFGRVKRIEAGFRSMKIPYIPKEASNSKSVVEYLRDGDMISFVSKKEGLDSSHVALLRIENGKPYMIHASLKGGKVIWEKSPLYDYFKYFKRDSPGFRVVRLR